jgi:hypothetical protein
MAARCPSAAVIPRQWWAATRQFVYTIPIVQTAPTSAVELRTHTPWTEQHLRLQWSTSNKPQSSSIIVDAYDVMGRFHNVRTGTCSNSNGKCTLASLDMRLRKVLLWDIYSAYIPLQVTWRFGRAYRLNLHDQRISQETWVNPGVK